MNAGCKHSTDTRAANVPISVAYLNSAELAARRQEPGMLGEIYFGTAMGDSGMPAHPHAQVGMQQLNNEPLVEVWSSSLPVQYAQAGTLRYSYNQEVLFGVIAFASPPIAEFEAGIHAAYKEILNAMNHEGYAHLLRMWNYFPDITEMHAGLDRYQLFCRGRFHALEEYYGDFDRKLPSASAVGAASGEVVIYFVAARSPGIHRENPRQVSAYHYPPQYGPKSPSFARATLKRWGEKDYLYISGTASIVGYESRHPDDPHAQLEETLCNLRTLINGAHTEAHASLTGLNSISHLKAYIRRPQDVNLIRQRLAEVLVPTARRLYLRADVCRTDLLLEIEAVAET